MADLVRAAIQINREASWEFADRRSLVWLSKEAAEACAPLQLNGSSGLEAVRLVVRDKIHRTGIVSMGGQGPQLNADALREVVATEVRTGVAAAGRERWSTAPLSKAIERFLEAPAIRPRTEGQGQAQAPGGRRAPVGGLPRLYRRPRDPRHRPRPPQCVPGRLGSAIGPVRGTAQERGPPARHRKECATKAAVPDDRSDHGF